MSKQTETVKTKKKFSMPDTYVIVFCFLIFACLLTYILPAGQFNTIEGSRAIDPDSFHLVDKNPAGIKAFLGAFFTGMINGRETIFLVFMIGGAFQVLMDTGSVDAILALTIKKTKGNYKLILPAIMVVMSILGAMGVGNNVALAFVPIVIIFARKLRLDGLVVVGVLYLASNSGFSISPINPFTVLLGQNLAGVTQMSGLGPRLFMWFLFTAANVWYVMYYCKKIQKDPTKSLTGILSEDGTESDKMIDVKPAHLINFGILAAVFVVYAYGGIKLEWGIPMLGSCMVVLVLACGIVSRMSPNQVATSFVNGAKTMVYSGLLIGFAGAISAVLSDASIIHTIVYYATRPLLYLPKALSVVGMYIVNFFMNFLTSSGSAQGYIVMPIMAPMADVLGVSRQIAVSAFQFGDGIGNVISPIAGLMMGTIGIAKVPFDKWLKFVVPFVLLLSAFTVVFLVIMTGIGWQ